MTPITTNTTNKNWPASLLHMLLRIFYCSSAIQVPFPTCLRNAWCRELGYGTATTVQSGPALPRTCTGPSDLEVLPLFALWENAV